MQGFTKLSSSKLFQSRSLYELLVNKFGLHDLNYHDVNFTRDTDTIQ